MEHNTISQPASRSASRTQTGLDVATRRDTQQKTHGPRCSAEHDRLAAPSDRGCTVMGPALQLRAPRPAKTTTTLATPTFAPQARPACASSLGQRLTGVDMLVWGSRFGAAVAGASRVLAMIFPRAAALALAPSTFGMTLVVWAAIEVFHWILSTGTQTVKRTVAGTAAGACAIAVLAPAAAPAALLAGALAGGVIAYYCTEWQGLVMPVAVFAILFVTQQVLSA